MEIRKNFKVGPLIVEDKRLAGPLQFFKYIQIFENSIIISMQPLVVLISVLFIA